jgi:inward rectifier potassium channel
VLISGVDETVAYAIKARHSYDAVDILSNHKFENIIHRLANGDRYFDYSRFHQVQQIDQVKTF